MLQPTNLFILNVQFCKSCPTHSWCTHHDEQKYLGTYQKLKDYLQQEFDYDIFVQGNVIPDQLVPIKPAQNKYFSNKTNKYVTFPSIGAFEVTLQSQLIFSKKKTNTWPNFAEIAQIIHFKLHGQPRSKSPSKKPNTMKNMKQKNLTTDVDIKTQKDHVSLKNQSFLDHNDKRSTFYKNRSPNQHKNFTLTDHFKNYHNGNYKTPFNNSKHVSDQYFTTANTDNQNLCSEISSFRNGNSSEKEFLQFKKNFDTFGLEGKLPEFFKKKAFMKENSGKKEMIIRLDSIEEESVLMDENNPTYGQNINLTNTHTTFKSKSKDNHKRLMKRFTDDFEELEAKFKHFEQRVQTIREENKKFDQRDSSGKLNDRILKEINDLKKKQKRLRSSEIKQTAQNEDQQDQTMDNPIIFARKKLKNIEDYINGTEQEKNQKLKKIYGEWKLLKKPYKGRNYVSPYKLQVSKRTGKTKNNKSKDDNEDEFSSSCSSSEQQVKKQKSKPKIPKHKLPKMTGLKSSKSNQLLAQEKFYSTARQKFQEFGSQKLNAKFSEKKFDSFSNNSAQKQFHRATAGIKLNTFDNITQGQKDSQFYVDSRIEAHPHSFNHNQKPNGQKSKHLKSIPKRKGKEHFLTKQTSSRQMNRSSRKIHLNELDDKYVNDDQKLDNEVSVHKDINLQSRKAKNALSNKNAINSHSKSMDKKFGPKVRKQQLNDSSQENEDASSESQQQSHNQQVDLSYQNSQSLQDNFFTPVQPNGSSVYKKINQPKRAQQISIGKTKQWGTFQAQIQQKNKSQKRGRKLLTQKQALGDKNQRQSADEQEQDNIDAEQESPKRFTGDNSTISNLLSQNQVISTNQHKLSKKSKAQKDSQMSKTKKSTKIQQQQLQSNRQSQNLQNSSIQHDTPQIQHDTPQIQHDTQQMSTKRNSLEKGRQITKNAKGNKNKISSNQTIRLEKEGNKKQVQTGKLRPNIKDLAESQVSNDEQNQEDEIKSKFSNLERSGQQKEEYEDMSDMQSQNQQNQNSQEKIKDKASKNQKQSNPKNQTSAIKTKQKSKLIEKENDKKVKQQTALKSKDKDIEITSQQSQSGHLINQNKKTQTNSQNYNQRGENCQQNMCNDNSSCEEDSQHQNTQKNIVETTKKEKNLQGSKSKKVKTKQSTLKPYKKQQNSIVSEVVDSKGQIINCAQKQDQNGEQSVIEESVSDQGEQVGKQVGRKAEVQTKNKKVKKAESQAVDSQDDQQIQQSKEQSNANCQPAQKDENIKVKNKKQTLNKPSRTKTQQQQSQLPNNSVVNIDNDKIQNGYKSSIPIKQGTKKASKSKKTQQKHQAKALQIEQQEHQVANQDDSDEIDQQTMNFNKTLETKDIKKKSKKTATNKIPIQLSQNQNKDKYFQQSRSQSEQTQNQGQKSSQSQYQPRSESQHNDNSQSNHHLESTPQSEHSATGIIHQKKKNHKHKQLAKQGTTQKSRQQKDQLQHIHDENDKAQPQSSSKSQIKPKSQKPTQTKKSSQFYNDPLEIQGQQRFDVLSEPQDSSEQKNTVNGQQYQVNCQKKQKHNSQFIKKTNTNQNKAKIDVKKTKRQPTQTKLQAKENKQNLKCNPNSSISPQNSAEQSQQNLQNPSSDNKSSKSQKLDSQAQDQLNEVQQNSHEQSTDPKQQRSTSMKKSTINKKTKCNKNKSKQQNKNSSLQAQITNGQAQKSLEQQQEMPQSQLSNSCSSQQVEAQQSLQLKSCESALDQNIKKVNNTSQKSHENKKMKKLAQKGQNKQVNEESQSIDYQEEQSKEVDSDLEDEKQKNYDQAVSQQTQSKEIQGEVNKGKKTKTGDSIQKSVKKLIKVNKTKQSTTAQNPTTQQQTKDQRPINTARSNRNKILNVYETDRCKDQEQGSDEESLKVSQQSETSKVVNAKVNADQGVDAKSKHKDSSGAVSKDVGIQMDNSQVSNARKSSDRDENKEGKASAKESQQTENNKQNNESLIETGKSQKETFQKNEQNLTSNLQEPASNSNRNHQLNNSAQSENVSYQNIKKSGNFQQTDSTEPKDTKTNQNAYENLPFKQKKSQKADQIALKTSAKSPSNNLSTNKVIRAPITKQFYGTSFSNQLEAYPNRQTLPLSKTIDELPTKSYLSQLPVSNTLNNFVLFNPKSIEVQKISLHHPLPNLIKCIKILSEINQFLVVRLFQDPFVALTGETLSKHVFGVWLCINSHWGCVHVDMKQVLLSQQTNEVYYMNHLGNQLWPIVLQKALAHGLGSYSKLSSTPCYKLFSILTGSNSLFFNIKQDPTKNSRILRYINDCENKNFVIHAEKVCKNLEELQNKDKEAKIYYVLSQRIVNESDTLLQIRDSSKPESQWIKLSKFVQEFKSIQILQLRINHNFSCLILPKPTSTQSMTIISLEFDRESFGSITLSTEPSPVGLLRTYLYKEQKSNYLKLVGQAQQKNKATLFFDCCFAQGKYWLFVECGNEAQVTYLGENQPKLQLVEQIKGDGLRNDWTQYLPVKTQQNSKSRAYKQNLGTRQTFKMPNKLNVSKFSETGMSFKSQDDKISRLRENFIDYLLRDKEGV